MAPSRVDKFVNSLQRRQSADANGMSSALGTATSNVDLSDGHLSNGSLLNGQRKGPSRAATPSPPIFEPQMLTQLGRLELISNTVVGGFLSGKHRSTHKGGCTDFAEYRSYAPGDDIRHLDWRQYAKRDEYYVRRYEDETNLQALLIVDASGSMQFGMSTVTKWRYAQMLAACLGHLLLRQRDSVGLAVVDDALRNYVRPLPRASHLARVLDVLEKSSANGESALEEVLLGLTDRLKRRGMVILISDCFCDVDRLRKSLQQFRARGHDVIVFQILAPEELTFPFRRESFFRDLELPRQLQINPNTVRKQYLEEFQSFMDQLRQAVLDVHADLVTLTTDQDLGESLAHYLRRRTAMKVSLKASARA